MSSWGRELICITKIHNLLSWTYNKHKDSVTLGLPLQRWMFWSFIVSGCIYHKDGSLFVWRLLSCLISYYLWYLNCDFLAAVSLIKEQNSWSSWTFVFLLTLCVLLAVPLLRWCPHQTQRGNRGQCRTAHHQKEGRLSQPIRKARPPLTSPPPGPSLSSQLSSLQCTLMVTVRHSILHRPE